MKKYLYIIIISAAIIFIGFNLYYEQNQQITNDSTTKVQNIKTSYDVISFYDRELCTNISKQTAIELENIIIIGYLADEYIKTHCDIDKTGFVFKDNKPINPKEFTQLVNKVSKEEYVLLNTQSNKYHHITCKFAESPKEFKIILKSKLPKNAEPCKACHNNTHKTVKKPIIIPSLYFISNNIKVFLVDYTTNLTPSRECKTNACKEIVTQINNSKSSIDMALYGYESVPAIDFALTNALKRGVQIRLVYDIDSKDANLYADTKRISEKIKNSQSDKATSDIAKPVEYTNSLMHNKFFVFDNKIVITGSANLSPHDMCGFNSNSVIEIFSPQIADLYRAEFEQMYNSKFHNYKEVIPNKSNIKLGNSIISIYFSPKDNTTKYAILPLINKAKKYIYIPTFLITDKYISNALIEAKNRGVDVKMIVDAVNAKSKASKHQIMRDNGILVKTENYAGKLHSKSMIIDDKYTVIGSMNFSYSGNYKNDENVIVIENPEIATFYRKFFEYLWSKIYTYWQTHDVPAESIYSIGSCSDGVDNDYDGLIDSADSGCQKK